MNTEQRLALEFFFVFSLCRTAASATPLWIMNAIQYLKMPPLNSPADSNHIGASSWRNSKVGHLMILSLLILLLVNASGSQQIFQRKVKDLGLFLLCLIHLEQDNEEAVDGEDDEDVPMELSMLVVTRADNGGLPTGYNSEGD